MINATQGISFQGIKLNQEIAEAALHRFRRDFPNPISGTKVGAKLYEHEGKAWFEPLRARLKEKTELLQMKLSMFQKALQSEVYSSTEEYIDTLKGAVKAFNMANCRERADIIRDDLLEHGIPCDNFRIKIKGKKHGCDHYFTVIGIKDTARFRTPKGLHEGAKMEDGRTCNTVGTWGNKAVVVDAWGNITMKAQDAIEYYKRKFNFDPSKEILTVKDANR